MRRDTTLYWWGQTASSFGSVFTAIALPIVAVEYLHASAGEIGLLTAAGIVPVLLLGLPAGALADRIARPRRVLAAMDLVSAVAVAVMALGLAHRTATVGWLVCLGVLMGLVGTLCSSLYFVHLRHLVGGDSVGPVRARLQAGQFGAGVVGRLLAGPAVVALGSAAALAVDGASYVLSALALLAMRTSGLVARESTASVGSTLRGSGAGLRFFAGDGYHRALLVFIVVPAATSSGLTTLTAPFLLRSVHLPVAAYGSVFALAGLLGLAGSTAAGRVLTPGRDPRQVTLAGFAGAVLLSLLLPMASGPLPLAAACAALGIGLPVFCGAIANVAIGSVLVADVPEDVLGRSMAALQVSASAAALLGALGSGALGDALGIRAALWTTGLTGVGAVACCLPPALVGARRLRAAERAAGAAGAAQSAGQSAFPVRTG
ncbi:MFS transporter [Streptacidiphilus sp. PB12-B1b]|uniref:MFS transporter n=1 Tax=Streptacidiphilus sp. PB12-B1b TaxID=2705012 RepID=UPI0015F93DD9|nr:MFS transporter [Streptacidiphilus sp. PB12-B1b]QMU78067.1 MFS transporter [Streptacidiphilus sp. PB12-B1b]